METFPTPKTTFRVWGQALYRLKGPDKGDTVEAHRLLFAISDEAQQWLGWYYFGGFLTEDWVLLAGARSANHKVVGQFSGHYSLLHTGTPMTVEELAGPILWSERGKWRQPKMAGPGFRSATIRLPDHSPSDHSIIRLRLLLHHDTGAYQFSINVKKNEDFGGHDFEPGFSERGYLNFIMLEPFRYPTVHLDSEQRLRVFRRKLTTA